MKRNDTDITRLPTLIIACCILHNFCEDSDEEFNPRWDIGQPDVRGNIARGGAGADYAQGERIRNALVAYFSQGH